MSPYPSHLSQPSHTPLDVARRAIRKEICTICSDRPACSEGQGPECVRPCEGGCSIFVNLPVLLRIVHRVHTPTLGGYERAMRELICQRCELSPTAGDYCGRRSDESCQLARYEGQVVDVLERVDRALHRGHVLQH